MIALGEMTLAAPVATGALLAWLCPVRFLLVVCAVWVWVTWLQESPLAEWVDALVFVLGIRSGTVSFVVVSVPYS